MLQVLNNELSALSNAVIKYSYIDTDDRTAALATVPSIHIYTFIALRNGQTRMILLLLPPKIGRMKTRKLPMIML